MNIHVEANWETRKGFVKERGLILQEVAHLKNIWLHTAAKTRVPITELTVKTQGEAPIVKMAAEDGLYILGPVVRVLGSCGLNAWDAKINVSSQGMHSGLIIPGEFLVFDTQDGPARSRSWIKGWRVGNNTDKLTV